MRTFARRARHHARRAGGRALAVVERYGRRRAIQQVVGLELVRLVRDLVGWREMLEYVESLPRSIARHPVVLEQRALALEKVGDPAAAAAEFEELIVTLGPTPERLGLLGGRYKQLSRVATSESDRRRYLDRSIEAYERGMLLDLNDYYSASNLARLYRERDDIGDAERATDAQLVTMRACSRSIELGINDDWARPTLLGCAFARRDVAEGLRLLREMRREGLAGWILETTIAELEQAISEEPDGDVRAELEGILAAFKGELAETGFQSSAPLR
jgi:tetratricopeptide (TPR) repeat protein